MVLWEVANSGEVEGGSVRCTRDVCLSNFKIDYLAFAFPAILEVVTGPVVPDSNFTVTHNIIVNKDDRSFQIHPFSLSPPTSPPLSLAWFRLRLSNQTKSRDYESVPGCSRAN